ncbi:MAG: M23 family metallopeptidase [Lachnospiraceae bacterium]|nr:M23 family metallopeptidase [Lachnospiraceae bacterium]
MQKRDSSILQKVKDNAFYVALGLGLVAILAVVAVYTMGQSGGKLAKDDSDVKSASEYVQVQDSDKGNAVGTTGSVDREIAKDDNNVTTDKFMGAPVDLEDTDEDSLVAGDSVKDTTEKTTEADSTEDMAANDVKKDGAENAEQIPVTADAGELNFNSEKTISWPVSGSVILPFSMETTVYFETLDQYRCNPGMLISAGNGTTVKSAFLGKVTKVTSDNVYGNMVTMYLGNDYSVTYGQLDTIYVKEGDFVKAGESVGTIGNPTDSFSEEGSHLYFEMTEGDTPVDPVLFME